MTGDEGIGRELTNMRKNQTVDGRDLTPFTLLTVFHSLFQILGSDKYIGFS